MCSRFTLGFGETGATFTFSLFFSGTCISKDKDITLRVTANSSHTSIISVFWIGNFRSSPGQERGRGRSFWQLSRSVSPNFSDKKAWASYRLPDVPFICWLWREALDQAAWRGLTRSEARREASPSLWGERDPLVSLWRERDPLVTEMRSLGSVGSAVSRAGCITSFLLLNKLFLWPLGTGRLRLVSLVPGHWSSGKNMQLPPSG